MDVYESEQALRKHRAVETPRRPLVSAEKNNAIPTRRSATREVSSRYKSPSPAAPPSGPRRCPSPNLTRTTPTSSKELSKRAHSTERKRPATPSPPSPSTPVHDSSVDVHLSSRRVADSRLPESLWPSTMRSLSVSFQSDSISIPVSKKEKPVTSPSDRTLRPTSNVAHKQVETSNVRKPTPERKRSPLKGKNVSDQSENSKPVDGLHSWLIDQHRWPSRAGGKLSSNALNRSADHADKIIRTSNTSFTGTGVPSLRRFSLSDEASKPLQMCSHRRLSLPNETSKPLQVSSLRRLSWSDEASKPLQKPSTDAARLSLLVESGRIGSRVKSIDDSSRVLSTQKSVPATPSDKTGLAIAGVRSLSLSSTGSCLPSPSKTSVLSSSSSRGVSPARSRPSTPPSRGVSPSRIRPTNSSSQSNNPISVLSFIADFKKGKKGVAYIEDAHHLRLLYNRYLQWRLVNARAEDVLYIQNVTVERTLYNVLNTTLSMWESIIRKRINLQQLQLELKLNYVLNDQMTYLDDWAVCESDHVDALSGAVEDLEASTLRLPVTGGAKADIEHLKVAICSAVDIMQAMGSAICPLLSRVEGMNNLMSEVAVVSAQEKAMLEECEALLTSAAAMQVEANSLRTHLMQMKQALETYGREVVGRSWLIGGDQNEVMMTTDFTPNPVTITTILSACAQLGALSFGKWVHQLVTSKKLEPNIYVSTALIDMYAKCGNISEAWQLFDSMSEKNTVTWNTMIFGYGLHGHGCEALKLFDEMLCLGFHPSSVTFLSVLYACSHAGLVREGDKIFLDMVNKYGIEPLAEHYACMVDILGRAGQLEKALEFIRKMPVEPGPAVWGTLLGACMIHKDMNIARVASDRLFELDPGSVGYHVLLSNIYSAERNFPKAASIREGVKKRKLAKTPGCTLIEVNGTPHVFVSGDRAHSHATAIYAMLEKLTSKMREMGYNSETVTALHDVEEEEKELMVNVHSEKLAIAFGLITTEPGTEIRIIKNLRVCLDCHSATKYISKITERVIVVRDANRFHHFEDGICSCGDYW